ncbi:hypothetical protein HYH02_000561 [Chlamydomonas schloesseri]|uniref:Peptidase M11 gametolysin domain-containing protein n=1 Tax=Chlamydomonas schloesseri TaxID=2026947 RepID=A0A835WUV7_9CHLO|nr:hypothetical protein HYH02_000561 [Chlamydomonas schloesseri]|eukprot:KAG2454724.1 hypothetical protein HYH02_000561 [Chlamydomonas schloesseri]
MARHGLLYKLLLVAGLCLALQVDAASRSYLTRPPPLKRPPPHRSPSRQPAPSPAPQQEVVTVIVNVTGQLSQSLGHGNVQKDASSDDSAWNLVLQEEQIARLVPVSPKTPEEASVNTRIELDTDDTLITGDPVDAPLALDVPKALAERLGLDIAPDGGPAEGDSSTTDGATGSRRRLTEVEHRARRMILDFHGTRRSLAEFNDLTTVLSELGVQNQVPKAKIPKSSEKKKNGGAKDLMIIGGKPLNVTSITFFFTSSSCGINPVLSESQIRARWYDNGDSAPVTASLQRYHRVCSYNKLGFYPDRNLVFGPIDVPCTGTMPTKGAYDLRKGKGNKVNLDGEMYGLYDLAKNWLRANRPEVLAQLPFLRRKVLVWPWNNQAQLLKNGDLEVAAWAGMANMGCPGNPDPSGIVPDCLTWMNTDLPSTTIDLTTLFQELGHNIGLAHSTRTVCDAAGCAKDEYGDSSDPMGGAGPISGDKSYICLSAPQAYKAGWAVPLADLKSKDLEAGGGWMDYNVPSAHTTDTNYLRIAIDQTGILTADRLKPERAIYVSYRVAQPLGGFDSGLPKELNARVWVHEYNETATGLTANLKTPPMVLNMLDLPQLDPKTKKVAPPVVPGWNMLSNRLVLPRAFGAGDSLTIWLRSKTNTSAAVSLCRTTASQETPDTCYDSIDNDCDGLTDAEDPDCGGDGEAKSPPPPPLAVLRKSPPPSPPPPPPPPMRATMPPPPENAANVPSPRRPKTGRRQHH